MQFFNINKFNYVVFKGIDMALIEEYLTFKDECVGISVKL